MSKGGIKAGFRRWFRKPRPVPCIPGVGYDAQTGRMHLVVWEEGQYWLTHVIPPGYTVLAYPKRLSDKTEDAGT